MVARTSPEAPVIVVGAGLAGLVCSLTLERAGVPVMLLEASDRPGGRVRTDEREGFLLDRGFQVLLTAYPTFRRWLDVETLELQPFLPGARVRRNGRWATLSDPVRRPREAWPTLTAPVGSPLDKLRVLALRHRASRGSLDELFAASEMTTAQALAHAGFSKRMRQQFWAPFLRGVFLEPALDTSSRFLFFVLRMFAQDDIAVPALGMEQIPRQLASRLHPGTLRTGHSVQTVAADFVQLMDGGRLAASHVVVATDPKGAARLLHEPEPKLNGGLSVWFAADAAPMKGAWLLLNGDGHGLVNHVSVMSEVSRRYAPVGQALVCVNVVGVPSLGEEPLVHKLRAELRSWFGPEVERWRVLAVQPIPDALPAFSPPTASPESTALRNDAGIWLCGDHRRHPSIEGAMASGEAVGNAIVSAHRAAVAA